MSTGDDTEKAFWKWLRERNPEVQKESIMLKLPVGLPTLLEVFHAGAEWGAEQTREASPGRDE